MTHDPPATFRPPTERHLAHVAMVRDVWSALTTHPNATLDELVELTGIAQTQVQQALIELERIGYVRRTARTARSAVVVVPLIERHHEPIKPNAWYEEQQPDDASADDADTAGILAAQERFRRWFGLPADNEPYICPNAACSGLGYGIGPHRCQFCGTDTVPL